ncbi:acyl-CoA dehydrogenase family protein [Fulvivirgaceae bacterium BMA12]|uniref:Acyl-CoA dehydrogenase family protein n=1 Tax=Agaribacillus aureus TaxID=3051825 RepID=A0ABT8LBT8_9BACT|nr:acyl-CoA dehydrogenase family protein [Fulvivirgaceae bacterium BMA12]
MDFSWSEEQIKYRDSVVRFAQETLNDDLVDRDKQGSFSRELWQKCAQFGIQGLAAPAQYGGQREEIDILSGMLAMEGFGYGCRDNGLALALNAQMWTVQVPIAQFGTEAQKEKYLNAFTSGQQIGAHALTEPDAGSDILSMKMTAEKCDGGYVLNGEKRLITLAPIADVVLVFANVNPKLGRWGVSAFLVEKGEESFKASPVRDKMGMRTVPFGELKFENCFVPEENRLGKEGAGFSILNHSLEYDRCCILASQLGAMERQLEQTIKYVQERQQFGQPIGQFQSVSNRIADMKLRLETSRLLLYKVAWLKKNNKPATLEAALLKLHLSESFIASSLDAIRNYGGSGYMTDFEVERNLRDAVGGVLYAGTSDIQRNIIAKWLGL